MFNISQEFVVTDELVKAIGQNLLRISAEKEYRIGAGQYYFSDNDNGECYCPVSLLAMDNNYPHGADVHPFVPNAFIIGFDGCSDLSDDANPIQMELGNRVFNYLGNLVVLSFNCARRVDYVRFVPIMDDNFPEDSED